ncbi:uncharacterized protein [Diabrotica undecimpunctata]|uniref:uncharacterized protein n=1 Tax=Diabrotica undecimpunctata TaxID=50387 RepID=UPI003B642A2B
MKFKPISERILYIRANSKPNKLSIINVYALTENSDELTKQQFYETLEENAEKIPEEDVLIIIGDCNTQIGKENCLREMAGENSVHDVTNNNGERLCNLAASLNMDISSTRYKISTQNNMDETRKSGGKSNRPCTD